MGGPVLPIVEKLAAHEETEERQPAGLLEVE